MEPTEKQLEKLKRIELNILQEYIKACEILGLNYCLIGGTLLGAIRHKGFIPWDDDIDVAMPRKDYEVFIREAQKVLPNNLFVQSFLSDSHLPYNFCKVRDNNTTFIETATQKRKIHHGVFIDVFPLDNYPEDKELSQKIQKKKKKISNKIGWLLSVEAGKASWKRRILTKIICCFTSIEKEIQRREKLYLNSSLSTLFCNNSGAWGEREILPKAWFDETIEVDFEGIKAKAPKEYDQILTKIYGDYMTPPPKEKQVGHHYCTIIDLENSYKNYIKE